MEYDDPNVIEVAANAELKMYKKMTREQKIAYDKQLKQNFDILSRNQYSSSVTSSEINV